MNEYKGRLPERPQAHQEGYLSNYQYPFPPLQNSLNLNESYKNGLQRKNSTRRRVELRRESLWTLGAVGAGLGSGRTPSAAPVLLIIKKIWIKKNNDRWICIEGMKGLENGTPRCTQAAAVHQNNQASDDDYYDGLTSKFYLHVPSWVLTGSHRIHHHNLIFICLEKYIWLAYSNEHSE